MLRITQVVVRRCSTRLIIALALIAVFGLVSRGMVSLTTAAQDAPFVDGQLIVGFKAGVEDHLQQGQVVARHRDQTIKVFQLIRARLIKLSGGRSVVQAIREYRGDPAIAYAEPNFIVHATAVPNDPYYGQLWGLKNTGQQVNGVVGTPGADIRAEPAWGVTTGSATIVVGVVDTGVDYTHPDLAANIWSNPGGIGGCPGGSHGYNAITQICDPMDDNNHGSHVSGTIGAVGNNGIGVVGVNWTTSIMGLKFLNASGSGTTADAIVAIDFAVRAKIAGVRVRALNSSWGGGGFSQALLDEIIKAGQNDILFVTAAGNSAANVDGGGFYPCGYTTAPNLICVAATDQNDGLAWFSNYGPSAVHLGAPGTNTYSTVMGGSYAYLDGTSMATPHVTGAAALILSVGYLSVDQLKSRILSNVDPLPSLAGLTVTGGRLNACKAIPGCGASVPDFSISITPGSQTVVQGEGTSYTVNITRTGGFAGYVLLSVSGLPVNVTGTFTPNPAFASSTLAVSTATTTPAGSYAFDVTGTSGNLTRTAIATLIVNPMPAPDFALSITPTSQAVVPGASLSYTINIDRFGGFAGSVALSVSGLPTAASGTFSPNPASGNTSALTVTTSLSTPPGEYPLTVTGTSGGLTHNATATLVVAVFR